MGLMKKTMAWLRGYLLPKKQYIKNTNDMKYLFEIACGVPQGSIFGPLLLLGHIT